MLLNRFHRPFLERNIGRFLCEKCFLSQSCDELPRSSLRDVAVYVVRV